MLVIFHFPGISGEELSVRAVCYQNMDFINETDIFLQKVTFYVFKRKFSKYFTCD